MEAGFQSTCPLNPHSWSPQETLAATSLVPSGMACTPASVLGVLTEIAADCDRAALSEPPLVVAPAISAGPVTPSAINAPATTIIRLRTRKEIHLPTCLYVYKHDSW